MTQAALLAKRDHTGFRLSQPRHAHWVNVFYFCSIKLIGPRLAHRNPPSAELFLWTPSLDPICRDSGPKRQRARLLPVSMTKPRRWLFINHDAVKLVVITIIYLGQMSECHACASAGVTCLTKTCCFMLQKESRRETKCLLCSSCMLKISVEDIWCWLCRCLVVPVPCCG